MAKLTAKRRRFAEEYVVDWNATQAAIRAGYSKKTARSQGQRLLTNVDVQAAVEKCLDALSMTAAEALKRLSDMARGTLHRFIRVDDKGRFWFNIADEEAQKHLHLIKKIKTRRKVEERGEDRWEVEWIEVELHDAKDALDKILRAHGAYVDKLDVTSGGKPITRIEIVDPGGS